MTEQEWLTCDRVWDLIGFMRGKVTHRKERLFAVACCHHIWNFMTDDQSRQAVKVAELYADGRATKRQLLEAKKGAEAIAKGMMNRWTAERSAAWAALWVAAGGGGWFRTVETAVSVMTRAAADRIWQEVKPVRGVDEAHSESEVASANTNRAEQSYLAELLRHMMGNPFRPCRAPDSWPTNVIQLAAALYEGQDCSFALHDALLEAGHADLAQHFEEDKEHPKGCWVVDLLLGKE